MNLNNTWKRLNGKKTIIAEFYWTAGASLSLVWFPEGLPDPYNKAYLSIGILLTFLGLGHKGIKRLTIKKNDNE